MYECFNLSERSHDTFSSLWKYETSQLLVLAMFITSNTYSNKSIKKNQIRLLII